MSDLPRAVLGSLVTGMRSTAHVSPLDMSTASQRSILKAVRGIESDGLPVSLELVSHRLGEADDLQAELHACEQCAVFSEKTLDALVVELRKERRIAEMRAGALALASGLDARFAPESVRDALTHLNALAHQTDGGRAPLHVSKGLDRLFTQGPQPSVPLGLECLLNLDITAGQLVAVGARPGIGKTAFLGTVAQNAAQRGWDVLFLSLEMPTLEIQQRLLSGLSGIPLGDVKRAQEPVMLQWAKALSGLSIWVEDGDEEPRLNLDLEGIRAVVKLFAEVDRDAGRNRVVLVDYLQFIRTRHAFDRRHDAVSHICKELKRLARDAHIPVIVAAQLNRAVEQRGKDARPQMSDLAESSEIEKTADKLVFLHREMPDGQAWVKVAKNRQGPCWTSELAYRGELCRFEDIGTWT